MVYLTIKMDNRPIVSMSQFGFVGRFANMCFQYAALRIYAKENNFRLQIPSWIGQYLFGHNDTSIQSNLPLLTDGGSGSIDDVKNSSIFEVINPPGNIDLWGYFQYHTSFYLRHKDFFCSLFKPVSVVQAIVEKTNTILRTKGDTVIGFHLRRGDFECWEKKEYSKIFFTTPYEWCLKWLDENWGRFNKPVLFIASDEIDKVIGNFSKYNPVTNTSLGISLDKASFYPDFYTLSQCDITCISNSSFSFIASMLNEKGTEFYRPKLTSKKFITYNPWDSYVLLRGDYL